MIILADQNIPYARECFSSIGTVKTIPAEKFSRADLRDVDAVVVRAVTPVNADLLNDTHVRFVATPTSGTDHIEVEYLKARDIGFASAAGGNANAVAEYVMAALFYLAAKYDLDLAGMSIGIIGVGHIGSKVAQKAEAIGMQVLLNDPPLQRETGDACYLSLAELFDCDFITLHTPLTRNGIDRTYHLVDRHFLDSLKSGVFIIHSARGAVADTAALTESLQTGHLAGAVVDVWENEPNIDLTLMDKVDIATPHIAGFTVDGRVGAVMMVYQAMCRYFGIRERNVLGDFLSEGEKLLIEIDPSIMNEQELIHRIIQRVYSIELDDTRMRKMGPFTADERAAHFIKLRRQYPVRREFTHTGVQLQSPAPSVAARLTGLGFQVANHGQGR
ncbi:MAG: 4-phosphoerythronate dehydrogenase [Fidelibacterota bacterium]|nr:MAG: 4-phosphoerythronate dehydrogenase [Candidatus Neomarinimicrobiota bacterium]